MDRITRFIVHTGTTPASALHVACTVVRRAERRKQDIVASLAAFPGTVVCVGNEVGQGIVPDNLLARQYRDWLGWLHQAVVRTSDRVFWVVAGIAVYAKRLEASL